MNLHDRTSRFELFATSCPPEWQDPLLDVYDTAGAIRVALDEWGLNYSPQLLLGLTRLVLERHDREANK